MNIIIEKCLSAIVLIAVGLSLSSCGMESDSSELAEVAGSVPEVLSNNEIIVKGIFQLLVSVNEYNYKFKIDAKSSGMVDVFYPASKKYVDIKGRSNLGTIIAGVNAVVPGKSADFNFQWTDKKDNKHNILFTVHKKNPDADGVSELHFVLIELRLAVPFAFDYYAKKSPYDINGSRQDYGKRTIWMGALIKKDGNLTSFYRPVVYRKAKYELNR